MKLFISYSSNDRDLCERLRLGLEAEGHSVFVDRAELKEGEPYHEALREAIADADALIYLVTPRSVAPGSYALSELDLAQRRWRRPAGRVLPVLVEPTPIAAIPPYLRSVTLLQPKGDLVAETVAAVARLDRKPALRRWGPLIALLVLTLGAGGSWWARERQLAEQQRQQDSARREALQRETRVAADLCRVGNHAVAWDQLERIDARSGGDAAVRAAREDCGMLWLRQMRVTSEKQTFGEFVGRIQPVLAEGLAAAGGARAADLRAHLGWADFLRSRDGVSAPKPIPQYEAALREDAGNVYAHAMWAHQLVWTSGRIQAEARTHFDAAVAAERERAWVRGLQFSVSLSRRDLTPYAMVTADDMRRRGETPSDEQRAALWRYAIDGPWLLPQDRPAMLAALPPAEHLATFEWLFPEAGLRDEQRPLWRFTRALLRAQAGDATTAGADLEALQTDLKAAGDDGRVAHQTAEMLAAWRGTPRKRSAK